MSRRVDALFAGEPHPAVPQSRARNARRLLWVGIPLVLLGIPLWTGVPGALIILWAWLLAEPATIDAPLPEPASSSLHTTRTIAAWTLGLAVLSLIFQVWLLTTDFYNRLWPALFGS